MPSLFALTRVAPTSAQLKCVFVKFRLRRKAAIDIDEVWFDDPDQYKSLIALVGFAVTDCSLPALELAHEFFVLSPSSSSEPLQFCQPETIRLRDNSPLNLTAVACETAHLISLLPTLSQGEPTDYASRLTID
jgi:hypothetical protein